MKSIKDYVRETISINFFAIGIKPDIQYTMNRLVKKNKGLSKKYLLILKNLWRYIVETKEFALIIGRLEYTLENLGLHIYRDANFANDLITRMFTGSHVVFLVGCPVTWKSKKQTIVTLSTIETKFINLTFIIKNVQ